MQPPDDSVSHATIAESDHPPPMGPPRKRRGATHALRIVGAILGGTLTFAVATAAGAIVHVNLAPARRLVLTHVNRALAGTFKGRIVVEHIGALGLYGIDGVRAAVLDPEGRRVLFFDGVRTRIGLPALVWSLLRGRGNIEIAISEVRVDEVEALFVPDPDGTPSLVRTFAERNPGPENPNARGVDVTLRDAELRHAWVHGRLASMAIDAEIAGLRGAARILPNLRTFDLKSATITAHRLLPEGQDVRASIRGGASMPSATGTSMGVSVQFEAAAGDVRVSGQGAIDGKNVHAAIDLPATPPDAVRALVPSLPLYDTLQAHFEATGTLPRIFPRGDLRVGEAEATFDGQLTLPDENDHALRASASLEARGVDLRALAPSAPASNLAASTRVLITAGPRGIEGSFDVTTPPGTIATELVPAAHLNAAFTKDSVTGTLHVAEPGAPTELLFSAHPDTRTRHGPRPTVVDFDTRVTVPDLMQVAHIHGIARGSARAHARGRVNLGEGSVDARLDGEVKDLARGPAKLGQGRIEGRAHGPFGSLELNARVVGANLGAGGLLFSDIVASADATMKSGVIAVRNAALDLTRAQLTVSTKVRSARIAASAIDLDGIVVEGLGAPATLSAHVRPSGLSVDADVPHLDLQRAAYFLNNEYIDAGHVAILGNVNLGKSAGFGQVSVDVRDAAFGAVSGGDAHIDLKLDGTHLAANARGGLPQSVQLMIAAPKITLPGGPLNVNAWSRATGALMIGAEANLSHAVALLPPRALPTGRVTGLLRVHVAASREKVDHVPSIALTAFTRQLRVQGPRHETANANAMVSPGKSPWYSEGLDVAAQASLDGETGHTEVRAQLVDALGTLASLTLDADAPLEQLARPGSDVRAILERLPLEGHLGVPRRSLQKLPQVLRKAPLAGDVELAVDLSGTALAPEVALVARARGIAPLMPPHAPPFDAEAEASYDGARLKANVRALRANGVVLDGNAVVAVPYENVVGGGPIPWDASGFVRMNGFPMDALMRVAGPSVRGALSGQIELRDLHRDANLEARLTATDVTVGRVPFSRANANVTIGHGTLAAEARADQTDGFAAVRASGGMTWGAEIAPSLDNARAFDVALDADNFRAAAALPFLSGIFSDLDGRIAANARLRAEPNFREGSVSGAIQLSAGRFEIPALGQEFHHARARIIMQPWGTLQFQDVSVDGTTGRLTAGGSAKLSGLRFLGAEARLAVARDEKIPLMFQGVPLGEAWGEVRAQAAMSGDRQVLEVKADVQTLRIDLPHSTVRAVQPLEPDPTIKIGMFAPDGRLELLPLGPPEKPRSAGGLTFRIALHLGDDIQIRREAALRVQVQGDPVIETDDQTRITGELVVPTGKIDVQGKLFTIEKATVSFTGQEPGNPIVVATAYWDAPDGTRVYADFRGPMKTGKLALRSEPPHSQSEILALILFGSTEGSFGASPAGGPDQSGVGKAAGLGGSYIAQGLNKALSGFSPLEITTRIDTSEADNPRPELQVQLSKDVGVQVAYNTGLPPPGDNPDRTLLRIDWRFIRNWTLETTVGNAGSSQLDVIWQYRY